MERATAVAGANNFYTIVASNAGPSYVTGAVVKDTFPSIFTGVTFKATEAGGATGFTVNGSGNIKDTVTMQPGSSITYKATGKLERRSHRYTVRHCERDRAKRNQRS